jgi:hypothetical protein
MSEKQNKFIIPLDENKFKLFLAGKDSTHHKGYALINEKDAELADLIHPLSHSLDGKNHPDLIVVPAGAKFSRDFKKLYEEVRK